MDTDRHTIQELRQFPLLEGFTDSELEMLKSILEYRMLKPGETLFHEGDRSNEIYFIQRGILEICKASSARTEIFQIHFGLLAVVITFISSVIFGVISTSVCCITLPGCVPLSSDL